MGLYMSLLGIVMADLAEETGEKRAAASLATSMRQTAYYDQFLKAFQLNRDVAANLSMMQAHLKQRGGVLSEMDLIKGFNQMFTNLVREQSRFLGGKATKKTVERLMP